MENLAKQSNKTDFIKKILAEQNTSYTIPEILDLHYETIKELSEKGEIPITFSQSDKLNHKLVCLMEQFIKISDEYDYCFKKNNETIYVYLGTHYKPVDRNIMLRFLGHSAEAMGLDHTSSHYFDSNKKLYEQFCYHCKPGETDDQAPTLINLSNGTLEIRDNVFTLLPHSSDRFLTYQLPFMYNERAECPEFMRFLDEVLPEKALQNILAEYLGYVFIPNKKLKLEKTLLLYGKGANGKSVFFDIVNALLGHENISNYSLSNLTDTTGSYRSSICNKLLNYASELDKNINPTIFKQLVSGEPIDAKLLYQNPFIMNDYARLMFNANELPGKVEQNDAYFRRIIIIPFDVTIPEERQDKMLAKRIIANELSGVMNWVLKGLTRLLKYNNFTTSDTATELSKEYRVKTNNVLLFMEDYGYVPNPDEFVYLTELYDSYRAFCQSNNYRHKSKSRFTEALTDNGFEKVRRAHGVGIKCYVDNTKVA